LVRLRIDPGLTQLRIAVVTMAAVLAAFFTAWGIESAAHLHTTVVVLAVALAMQFGRVHRAPDVFGDVAGVGLVVVVSAATVGIAWLMLHQEWIGYALFVLAIAFAIWIRRFGSRARRIGTLLTLPFIALLFTPPGGGSRGFQTSALLWSALVAFVATTLVLFFRWVGLRTGLLARRLGPPPEIAVVRARRAHPTWSQRMQPSTKLAAQMGLSLAIAFIIGKLVFDEHWPWVVLTAYVVAAANRGRAEVVHKSWQRIVGALVGTILASFVGELFSGGERMAVVLIFVVLAVATWLRSFNYAIYAGCLTAVIALLYAYNGQSGASVLFERLAAILCGAAISVLVAWFILPIRFRDVARRRLADALSVLSDYLTAARRNEPDEVLRQDKRFRDAMVLVEQLAPTLLVQGRLSRDPAHPLELFNRLRDVAPSVATLTAAVKDDPRVLTEPGVRTQLREMHEAVTKARRALRDNVAPPPRELPAPS
jgi:hypothetical protein